MVHQIKLLCTAPVVAYFGANFLSVLVGCALWFGVKGEHAVWCGFVGLISTYSCGMAINTLYLSKGWHRMATTLGKPFGGSFPLEILSVSGT